MLAAVEEFPQTWLGIEKRGVGCGTVWSDGTCVEEEHSSSYVLLKRDGPWQGGQKCYRAKFPKEHERREFGKIYATDNFCGEKFRVLCEVPCEGGEL